MYSLAQAHFKKVDQILYQASLLHEIEDLKPSEEVFKDLVYTIVSQQLSGKAAETIFNRVRKALGKKIFSPKNLSRLTPNILRECGLSQAKTKAIQGLAQAILAGEIDLVEIIKKDNTQVIETLTSLRGIGPWTAEMILMFSLGREDVFSRGDLGLKKAIKELYGLKNLPDEEALEKISKKWSPYRTYAARVLWKIADSKK